MPCSLDDYQVLRTIGSGTYGTCKKIKKKKDGKLLVWKELDYGNMTETEKQMLVSEVNLLRELKHQHIVRYYDRIIDRSTTTLYIIMEYCEGGDLATYIARLKKEGRSCDEAFVWKICYQVVSALKECHCRNKNGKAVLHRDLKPANVFLDNQQNVKLGDFGLARVLSHETSFAKTFVGTPYYMSPEQMNYMSYNEKSDVWSLGCMLYELCVLRPPFTASNQRELAARICEGHFQRLPTRYSNDLNEMIASMLKVEEYKRASIDLLLDHPLLLKHAPRDKSVSKRSSVDSAEGGGTYTRHEGVTRREELVRDQERHLAEREKALGERERQLTERERESVRRDRRLTDREQQVKMKEQELENREKTISLREKMTDDRLARVEKLLDSPRPKLESTRKLSQLLVSPRLPSPERLRRDDPEPGEIPQLELSDSGIHSTTLVAVRNSLPPALTAAKVKQNTLLSENGSRNKAADRKFFSRPLSGIPPVEHNHKARPSSETAIRPRSLKTVHKSSPNKENFTPKKFLTSRDPLFGSSPSLKMRLLGSPILDSSSSPRIAQAMSASPRLHRKYSLKEDYRGEARLQPPPRSCTTNTDGLADPQCVLKDNVLRMLKNSPSTMYKPRSSMLSEASNAPLSSRSSILLKKPSSKDVAMASGDSAHSSVLDSNNLNKKKVSFLMENKENSSLSNNRLLSYDQPSPLGRDLNYKVTSSKSVSSIQKQLELDHYRHLVEARQTARKSSSYEGMTNERLSSNLHYPIDFRLKYGKTPWRF